MPLRVPRMRARVKQRPPEATSPWRRSKNAAPKAKGKTIILLSLLLFLFSFLSSLLLHESTPKLQFSAIEEEEETRKMMYSLADISRKKLRRSQKRVVRL